MSRKETNALPFKSHTQMRDFSTLAIYKSALTEQQQQSLAEHFLIQPLKGFRQLDMLTGFPGVPETMGMTIFHNVRVFCRKPVVSFPIVTDPHGKEMFEVRVFEALKGYAEPKD